jgi:hypothetical protein
MTKREIDEWKSFHYRMDEEGFEYCFEGYSDWKDIEDEEFHRLRLQYLQSAKDLRKYIVDKYKSVI